MYTQGVARTTATPQNWTRTMASNKDADQQGKKDFKTQWEEYWDEMGELNQRIEEQQSVSSETLNLVFRV